MNYKLETGFGGSWNKVAEEAKVIAAEKNLIVEFEFNGVNCLVGKDTNLEWLWRDYTNSWLMGWKEVGHDCVEKYSSEVQSEYDKKKFLQDEKETEQHNAAKLKDDNQRAAYNEKTKGIEIELLDADSWKEYADKNQDPYGKCCVDYAESWAKLMQAAIGNGETIIQCAERTSHELGFYGITGFMYGAAVSMLSQCWKYGEELRKWHNKEYNHEGEGVVNPAILTLSIPE